MKITRLGIKNYRSFDNNGVFLNDLRKINIIIGKNNSGKSNVLRFLKTLHSNIRSFIPFQNSYSRASSEVLLETIKNNWDVKINNIITTSFNDIIYIPHLRVIQEGHMLGDSNATINGSNIISEMFQMQNPSIGKEHSKEKFSLIQNFVRELINKPQLEIQIPHTKDQIILTLDGNRLPLDSYGTGIHQLVLLCSTLVIHENAIVCIEEPEIHLHPELQRKFLNFLNRTNNTYFITTHSNVFLDYTENTSVYHVKYDGVKSEIFHAKRTEGAINVLEDLGYRSSDIMQANGVIWVEGPSDRVYLLNWLNLLEPSIKEGLHFVIMFYGGRLLSHLTFETEKVIDELIPLLKMNYNAFVIMDRDGFASKVKLNDTKKRIQAEIGGKKCWVTKGREIENYISAKSAGEWLNNNKFVWEADMKFESEVVRINPKIKYNTNKSKYAKEIIKFIHHEDLVVSDLKLKLQELINIIKEWNA